MRRSYKDKNSRCPPLIKPWYGEYFVNFITACSFVINWENAKLPLIKTRDQLKQYLTIAKHDYGFMALFWYFSIIAFSSLLNHLWCIISCEIFQSNAFNLKLRDTSLLKRSQSDQKIKTKSKTFLVIYSLSKAIYIELRKGEVELIGNSASKEQFSIHPLPFSVLYAFTQGCVVDV